MKIHSVKMILVKLKFRFFINCFHTILSQAEKKFNIIQCKQFELKYEQNKIIDYIQYVENCYNDKHYENILWETITNFEQLNNSRHPSYKNSQRATIEQ